MDLYNMAGDVQEEILKLEFENEDLLTMDRICDYTTYDFCG